MREQIIPRLFSPRISRSPISKFSLNFVPIVATGTIIFSAMLTPPHKICSTTPGAISVCVTRTFEIFGSGCALIFKIFPTTIFGSIFFKIAESTASKIFSAFPQQQHELFSDAPNSFFQKFIFQKIMFRRGV